MRRLAVLATAVAVLVACGGDDDDDAAATTDAPAATKDAAAATTAAAVDTTAGTGATTAPVEGFTFTSPYDDFTVVFPEEPTDAPQTVDLPDGTSLPVEFWVYESADSAVAASRLEYAAGTEVSLQGAADGAVANVDGTLTSSEPITLQGREGIRLQAEVPAGTYLSEIYADGLILYQLIAAVSGDASFDDPEAEAFFGSFQFTEDG